VTFGLRLAAIGVAAALLAACGGSAIPTRAGGPATPASASPAQIVPAPMAKTTILPASAMPAIRSQSDIQGLNWTQIPGAATQVAAQPDGSLWALSPDPAGPDKHIWHYAGGTWTNVSGLASHIAVAPDGTLYAVNSGGGTYAYSAGVWTPLGGGAQAVTAAADGSVYVLSNGGSGPDRAIWHEVNGTWTQVAGSGVALASSWDTHTYSTAGGTFVGGGLYVVNSAGAIWYENPDGSFAGLPGRASAIAATTSGGVFVLGYPSDPSGNAIYYYDLGGSAWRSVPGAGASVASDGSRFYALGASGAIYESPVTPVISMAFVANQNANSVTGYPIGASGDAPPSIDIAGSNTRLSGPLSVAVDASGRVLVANLDSTILVFAAGATGNVAPVAVIDLPARGTGLAVDSVGNIWVATASANAIYEFAANATGAATPLVTIAGSNTQLFSPGGLYVDPSGRIYVCDYNDGTVEMFVSGASGNTPPAAVIAGSHTQLQRPNGIAIDGNGRIVVSNGASLAGSGSVNVYPAYSNGDATPVAVIGGPAPGGATGYISPLGVAVDAADRIWVADAGARILEFASDATGTAAPLATISGPDTLMNYPIGPALH